MTPPRRGAIGRDRLVVLALVLVASIAYLTRIRHQMVDFAVGHHAGQRLAVGETLYQTADGHYMFKYLPASAIIYLPLGALPLDVAKPIWFAISLAALVLSFRLVRQLVPDGSVRHVWIIPALVLAKYILRELTLGQINLLATFVMLLAIRALAPRGGMGSEVAAGALTGLATALKPYAALLFPYLIVTGRWRGVASGTGVLAVALVMPSAFYGLDGNLRVLGEWAGTLAESTPAQLTNNDNVSVWAFFMKWTGDSTLTFTLAAAVLGVFGIVLLAVLVRGRGVNRSAVLEGAMVLTLIPLASPMGWDYTFLMALLAVALLVHHFQAFPAPARLALAINFALVGLTIYDVMGRPAYARYQQWSVTTVNFLVVIAGLAFLRIRRVC